MLARRPVIEDEGEVLTLSPIGSGGVDVMSDPSMLPPDVLSRCENVYLQRLVAERRSGALKLSQLSAPASQGKSRTFAATTKYATFTPPLITAGGWAALLHFIAHRTANTSWIVGARPSGQTFHVLKVTLSSAGAIVVTWRDSGGSDRTVTCTAVADDTTVHLLAIYDAVAGTFTVYVNGASSGTPLTGLSATLKPDQTAGVVWTFGVEKETGSAVTANSNFDGAHDGMTLFTLRGERAASTFGATTLAETLRRNSARCWPAPQAPFVLAHWDMDEASGTTMKDHSGAATPANGTYVGTPSITDPVALLSAPTNLIAHVNVPSGAWNVAVSFGNLFYEKVAQAVA